MGKIICGFASIGKSSVNNYHPKLKCYDLDSTYFKKTKGWEETYIDCALGQSQLYDYIFLTTYDSVLKQLDTRKIEWTLVFPRRELKEEYRNRFVKRENTQKFIDSFMSRWDEHINSAIKIRNKNKIILEQNEYISDVIDII